MSASEQLHEAYREWRRLAEAEGEAIRTNNWSRVQECQKSLHSLQPAIIRFSQEARNEWVQLGRDISSEENTIRLLIGELIELERRNSAWLSDMQKAVQTQLNQLQHTGHTLRQVQRSYAPASGSSWTSFS
jgi:hypothetical protein